MDNADEVKNLGVITQNTLVPVSLVVSVISGIFWISSLYYKVEAHAGQISKNEATIALLYTKLDEVNRRLYRMEGRMNIKDRESVDGN